MAVALNDLRGNSGNIKSEALADLVLELGIEVSAVADGTGELADAHLLCREFEAFDVTKGFGVPVGQLESKGDRLSVHAVGAADHRRVFEFPGAAPEHVTQLLQVLADDCRSLLDQQGLCGVDHVVGSKAVVEPARIGADFLGDGSGESNHVVLYFGFDCLDAIQVEIAFFADSHGRRLRHQAYLGERFGGGDFDFEPGTELVLVTPDMSHLGTRITCDQ